MALLWGGWPHRLSLEVLSVVSCSARFETAPKQPSCPFSLACRVACPEEEELGAHPLPPSDIAALQRLARLTCWGGSSLVGAREAGEQAAGRLLWGGGQARAVLCRPSCHGPRDTRPVGHTIHELQGGGKCSLSFSCKVLSVYSCRATNALRLT